MLLGTLLIVAPLAGAEPSQTGLTSYPANLYGVYGGPQGNAVNLKCSTGQSPENVADGLGQGFADRSDEWDDQPLDFAGLSAVPGSYTTVGTDPLTLDWSSGQAVTLVIVKQSTVSAVYHYPGGATSGTVQVVLPEGQSASTNGLSHMLFCGGQSDIPDTGQLTIVKSVTGAAAWSVPFSVEGQDPFTLTNEASTSSTYVVSPDTYEVTEDLFDAQPESMQFSSVSCSVVDTSGSEPGTPQQLEIGEPTYGDGGVSISVPVDADEHVTCTFENEVPDEPQLTVRKVVTGGNAPSTWDFDFELCPQVEYAAIQGEPSEDPCIPFTLHNDDVQTEENESEATFTRSGTYSIEELGDNEPDIVCTADNEPVGSQDGPAVYGVTVGQQDVLCVFTNDFPGTPPPPFVPPPAPAPAPAQLVLTKVVSGPAPASDFVFEVDGQSYELGDGESTAPISLDAGDYTVSEVVDRGAESTSAQCTNGAEGDGSVDLTLAQGQTVTCTFTNTFQEVLPSVTSSLTIVKQVQGDDAGDWSFDFEAGDLGPVTLTKTAPCGHSRTSMPARTRSARSPVPRPTGSPWAA